MRRKKLLVASLVVIVMVSLAACLPNIFKLTIKINGQGSVTPKSGSRFVKNAVVKLQPTPENDDWCFAYWGGSNSSEIDEWNRILMDGNKSVTANFVKSYVDFSNLVVNTVYHVGDVFTDSAVGINFESFTSLDYQIIESGCAKIDHYQSAGGQGQDLFLNNICANFDFVHGLYRLTFLYGEYGGNVNLGINNGHFYNIENISELDGLIVDDILITVTEYGNGQGRMTLNGTVGNFVIGGQELWIDSVKFDM